MNIPTITSEIATLIGGALLGGLIGVLVQRAQGRLSPDQRLLIKKLFAALDPLVPEIGSDQFDQAVRAVAEIYAPKTVSGKVLESAIAGYYRYYSPAKRQEEPTQESDSVRKILKFREILVQPGDEERAAD